MLFTHRVYIICLSQLATSGELPSDDDPWETKTMNELEQLAEMQQQIPFGVTQMTGSIDPVEGGYDPRRTGRSNWTTNEDSSSG